MIWTRREVAVAKRGGLFAFVALLAAAVMAASALALSFGSAVPAQAQSTNTITVNSTEDTDTSDDGACTLREAINNANSDSDTTSGDCATGSGEDRITFDIPADDPDCTSEDVCTITLGSQLPTITDEDGLSIEGEENEITVSGNDAVSVFVVDSGAELALVNLTVANGSADPEGGGIFNLGGTLTVTNSTFSENSADRNGGGISNLGGTLTVTDSTFSENSADGDGGGIRNDEGGTLNVTNSTFSGNSASSNGGGIWNQDSTANVTNSTFSGNSANSGGGIFSDNNSTTTLRNTLLASSPTGGNCSTQFTGTIIDGGGNLDDGTTCGFTAPSKSNADDGLDPDGLKDNGGPTQTIALLPTSDAIDMGVEATCAAPPVNNLDQRGVSRLQDGDGDGEARCDIGAFELEPDTTRPTITDLIPAPGSTTNKNGRDIEATVKDERSVLQKEDIRLVLDGQERSRFTYEPQSGRLVFDKMERLGSGKHSAKIIATDEAGNTARERWTFKIR